MTDQHILVLNTCPEDVTAAPIASVLVEERLTACDSRASGMSSTSGWVERYFGWLSQSVAPSGGPS